MHTEITHPCVQHKLALIRDVETGHKKFRELATEITMFVCYEALKEVTVRKVDVQTPLATASCRIIDEDIVVVPILRAGIGMLEGILSLVPSARVGFVGVYRDEKTKR
ncbi:MAG: uracil phosphoribosyltransferase, partial [Woeseiaceae bacterium]|nr:uracil phosphoribosyltransferase [Woeseiaceae bacterium]